MGGGGGRGQLTGADDGDVKVPTDTHRGRYRVAWGNVGSRCLQTQAELLDTLELDFGVQTNPPFMNVMFAALRSVGNSFGPSR